MKKLLSLMVVVLLVVALGLCFGNKQTMNKVQVWWDLFADRFQTTFCKNETDDENVTEPTDETEGTEAPADDATEPTGESEPEEESMYFVNSDNTITLNCRYYFLKLACDDEYGAFNVPHTDPEDRVVLPGADSFEMFKVHFGPCEGGTELNHNHEDQPVEFMLSGSSFSIICCKDEDHGFDELLWDGLPEALRFAVPGTRVELCKKCHGIANVREVMGKVVSEELTDEEWADLEKVAYYWWEKDEETNELVRVFGIRTCGCDNPDTQPGGPGGPSNPQPTDPTDPEPEHEHKYTEKVVDATCVNGGYTTHTCECGDTYNDNETPALGHDWGEWVVTKQPTATEDGEERCECKRCDAVRTESIPALGEPDPDPDHNDPTDPTDPDPDHNDPSIPDDEDDDPEDQPEPDKPDPGHNDQVLPEDDEDYDPAPQPDPEDDMVDLGSPDTDDGEPDAQPQPEPDPDHNDQVIPEDEDENPAEQPDPEDDQVDLGSPDTDDEDPDAQPQPDSDGDIVDLGTPDVEDAPDEQPAPQPVPDHNEVHLPEDDDVTETPAEQPGVSEGDVVDLGAPDVEDEAGEKPDEQPVPGDEMVDLGAPNEEDEPDEQPAPQPEPDHNNVHLPEDDDVTENSAEQPGVSEGDVVDLGAPNVDDEAESLPNVEENDSAENEIPVEGENNSDAQPEDEMVDLGAPDVEEDNTPAEQPAVQEEPATDAPAQETVVETPAVEEVPAETPADNEPAHSQVELPVDDEPAPQPQPEPQPEPQPQPEETVDLGSPAVDEVVDLGSPE